MTQFIVFTCDYRWDNGAKCGNRYWSKNDLSKGYAIAAARSDGWVIDPHLNGVTDALCPRHRPDASPSAEAPAITIHTGSLIPTNSAIAPVTPIRKR